MFVSEEAQKYTSLFYLKYRISNFNIFGFYSNDCYNIVFYNVVHVK